MTTSDREVEATERFAAIVGFDLVDGREPIIVPTADAEALLLWCARHRVEGLVAAALLRGDARFEGPDADKPMNALADQYHAALRTCLVAEDTAIRCAGSLTAAGIDSRVLKGVAISHLDYANPSQRMFGDADIIIERDRLDDAIDVLCGAGFGRESPPVRRWWERRFGKALTVIGAGDRELDLHVSLTDGYFGAVFDVSAMWRAGPDVFDLGGVRLRALPAEYRLLHACLHAELGNRSGVRTLRDVAQLILVRGVDWQAVVDIAKASRCDAVMASAIRRTWSALQLVELNAHPAHVWAADHRATAAQSNALHSYATAHASGWIAEGRSTLPALTSRSDQALYITGLVWPCRANLRSRGRTRRQHLRALSTSKLWRQ